MAGLMTPFSAVVQEAAAHGLLVINDCKRADIGNTSERYALGIRRVFCLGDIVGYGPEPDAVVDRLRELGAHGVRGNHDAAALGGDEIESFNVDARRAMEWTRSAISDRTRCGAL